MVSVIKTLFLSEATDSSREINQGFHTSRKTQAGIQRPKTPATPSNSEIGPRGLAQWTDNKNVPLGEVSFQSLRTAVRPTRKKQGSKKRCPHL